MTHGRTRSYAMEAGSQIHTSPNVQNFASQRTTYQVVPIIDTRGREKVPETMPY